MTGKPNKEQAPRDQAIYSGNILRRRLRILQAGLILFFGMVALRLLQIQVVDSGKYRNQAERQYESKIQLPATRGLLYDRNGDVIASNSMFVSFGADPKVAADDARAIAAKFSKLFGKPTKFYLDKLRSDSRFEWLERQVNTSFLKKIDQKKLEGIVVRYEPKRLYFQGQVGGQIVGTTNIDNKGLAGVELKFDDNLRGVDGYVVLQRDGLGKARPTVDYPRVEPQNGHNIVLTIDMWLQSVAEKELKKGIEQSSAERGIVVMLQPKTGEILAMAQYPNVDPNSFGKFQMEDQKLRAVTDMFEPGSVFKIVTASAALEHKLVTPEKKFFGENGEYVVQVAGSKPRTIRDTHKEGWMTFREAMEYSSNIVMAKVSDIIGSERLYKMARDYGFGIPTNVEYPGEVKGILKKPVEWYGTTLNTISYGYEIGATPLQIAAAYGAVANNGILMKPFLFKKEIGSDGQVISETQPQQIRRVVSETTAKTLTDFFEGVVLRGTGKPAHIEGARIAGKTGTSKKLVNGQYTTGNYTASFVGYFPADNPQVVCLVMMENPRGVNYTGGTTSAPVFRAIAEQVINSSNYLIPTVPQPGPAEIKTVMADKRPQKELPKGKQPKVATVPLSGSLVPDVTGLSVRKAVGILTAEKYQPVIKGSGVVTDQTPSPGQPAKAGMKIILTCQPKTIYNSGI